MARATKRRPRKFRWDSWERTEWAPPPEVTIDTWLEQNLVLPRLMTAYPGPLCLDLNPYIREVLRATVDPATEEISLKWATQLGKTLVLISTVFFYAKNDPWPALHIMPRDEDAESVNVERYQAVLRESPSLQDLRSDSRWAENKECIRLKNMYVYFTGAQSPAGLASRSVCLCMMDEVNKWPPWTGKEADPIRLARERTRWFSARKIIKCSTPTTEEGYISREFEISTREHYWVPCPRCGQYQVLQFGGAGSGPGIKWPEDVRDPHLIKTENLAWYECAHCHGRILDGDKPAMLKQGRWVAQGGEIAQGGVIYPRGAPSRRYRGFHLWAAYSPMLTFSEVASEFLVSKDRPETMMNFVNSWLAEDWRIAVNELRGAEVRERQDMEFTQGTVPTVDCWLITAGVDVQRPAGVLTLYYVLRGWGKEEESWLIKAGMAVGWEELYQVLFRSAYRNPAAERVPIMTALVDSGDGVNTLQVYDWCAQTGCVPSKGASKPVKHVQWTNVQRGTRTLALCLVNTAHYKTRLHHLIRSPKWHLPADMTDEYYNHMTAEQLVSRVDRKSGRRMFEWQVTSPGAPNHYFDCEVLALVGADLLQVPQSTKRPLIGPDSILRPRRVAPAQVFSR